MLWNPQWNNDQRQASTYKRHKKIPRMSLQFSQPGLLAIPHTLQACSCLWSLHLDIPLAGNVSFLHFPMADSVTFCKSLLLYLEQPFCNTPSQFLALPTVRTGSPVQISNDGLGNRSTAKMRLLITESRGGTHSLYRWDRGHSLFIQPLLQFLIG